jgi:Fe-S oxidoreductase
MAGSFGYEHFELSLAVGEQRLFPAVRSAVAEGRTVIACGISCRHQLRDALGVEARHWVQVMQPGTGAREAAAR